MCIDDLNQPEALIRRRKCFPIAITCVLIAFAVPTVSSGQNLLSNNGAFHSELVDWTCGGADGSESWAEIDLYDSFFSGSIQVVHNALTVGTDRTCSACVPVAPGTSYVLTASTFWPNDPSFLQDGVALLKVGYYEGINCDQGTTGSATNVLPPLALERWHSIGHSMGPGLPSIQSARVSIGIRSATMGGENLAFFDEIYFGTSVPRTLLVDRTDDEPAAVTCDDSTANDCSLRGAFIASFGIPGHTSIVLPAGNFALTVGGTTNSSPSSGDLDVDTSIVLLGAGADRTIIDGSAIADRIFDVALGAELILRDIAFLGGSSSSTGGGLRSKGKTRIEGSWVHGHQASSGGGLENSGGYLEVVGSTVSDNTATSNGGGLATGPGLEDDTILLTTTFTGNTAQGGRGGNLFSDGVGSFITSTGVTFANGTASSEGDLYYLGFSANAILAGNLLLGECSIAGLNISQGGNLESPGDSCNLFHGTDQVSIATPLVAPLADNLGFTLTHRVLPGSPANDRGIGPRNPPRDQTGKPRPQPTEGVTVSEPGAFEGLHQLTVTTTADTADGSCDVSDCSLRDAIMAANSYFDFDPLVMSEVVVPAGNYLLTLAGPDEDAAATGDLDVTKDLILQGDPNGGTFIDGNASDRVLQVLGDSRLTLVDVTIKNGSTEGNSSNDGGGIFVDGELTLIRSTITENRAVGEFALGGGIFANGSVLIDRSTVSRNTADWNGGGVHMARGPLTAERSTFSGNQSINGGGGAIGADSSVISTIVLREVTIADNTAVTASALHFEFDPSPVFDPVNSLIQGTCAASTSSVSSFGGNLESPGNTCGLNPSIDQVSVADPGLDELQRAGGTTETHPLTAGSPAIDSGVLIGSLPTDQRGWSQPIDGDGDQAALPDSGASEYELPLFEDGFESGDTTAWSMD